RARGRDGCRALPRLAGGPSARARDRNADRADDRAAAHRGIRGGAADGGSVQNGRDGFTPGLERPGDCARLGSPRTSGCRPRAALRALRAGVPTPAAWVDLAATGLRVTATIVNFVPGKCVSAPARGSSTSESVKASGRFRLRMWASERAGR